VFSAVVVSRALANAYSGRSRKLDRISIGQPAAVRGAGT
jgi:hypothetical protein